MEDLFRSYWWLLFPLAWFVAGSVDQVLRYWRHRDTLNLIRSYTDQGKEPPAILIEKVTGKFKADDWDQDDDVDRRERRRYRYLRRRDRSWSSVVLFGVLAVGFGVASFQDMYGAGEAFLIVTFVMGALCLASVVSVITSRRD